MKTENSQTYIKAALRLCCFLVFVMARSRLSNNKLVPSLNRIMSELLGMIVVRKAVYNQSVLLQRLSRVTRNSVLRVSDQIRHKPGGYTTTEDC